MMFVAGSDRDFESKRAETFSQRFRFFADVTSLLSLLLLQLMLPLLLLSLLLLSL